MPENDEKTAQTADVSRRIFFTPQLRTLKSGRRTVARAIREWCAGTISTGELQILVWSLGKMLAYYKESEAVELSDRLAAVEKKLKMLEVPNANRKDFPRIDHG